MNRKRFLTILLILALALVLVPIQTARANTYTVNTAVDEHDGSCSDGDCSLRDAIIIANTNPGADTIGFSIPGCGGVCTIQPITGLPTLTDDSTTIDGYTQPGALQATDTTPATLKIEIDGTNDGSSANGFRITSANNVIRGLAINRFALSGVLITGSGATGNTISGNHIGVDVNGAADLGNAFSGVSIDNGAQNNAVGGDAPGERNVISGNSQGVIIEDSGTLGNTVSGNYIGADASGAADLGNTGYGVCIQGAQHNTVGPDNLIAYNDLDGVRVYGYTAADNTIPQNSIYSNAMGINLEAGANGDIAAPVITAVTPGSVTGAACAGCTVELFASPTDDGEGQVYLGSAVADGSGNFVLSVGSLPYPYLTATATATDAADGTSEFSAVFVATVRIFLPLVVRQG